MAATVVLNLKTLAPLFLGGANQAPEWRAASFKGLLRFWYRAADPKFAAKETGGEPSHEERFFGGVESAGQSPLLLRLSGEHPPIMRWQDFDLRRFDLGSGRNTRNGLLYLGFPFKLRGGERNAIRPGSDFQLKFTILAQDGILTDAHFRKALLAACWLFASLGGAGSRSRRGFGSLGLIDWSELNGTSIAELNDLPVLSKARDPGAWRMEFERGLQTLREWFGEYQEGGPRLHHPRIGPAFSYVLSNRGWPLDGWAEALNDMGLRLQTFRLRKAHDYQDIKAHLGGNGRRGTPLRHAPSRASFGLPLAFRFSSARGQVQFAPYDDQQRATRERQGSLLFLRLALIANRLHPLYIRMHGDVPGIDSRVAIRRQGRALLSAKENQLDTFMEEIRRES